MLLSNFEVKSCELNQFSKTGIRLRLVLVQQINYKKKTENLFLIPNPLGGRTIRLS